jgi:hypothetical protein
LGTGEPPEVLRRLDVADVIATAIPGAGDDLGHLDPGGRLATLVRRRAVQSWCVRYVKARSAECYQQVYTRRDKQVVGPLSALVTLTAAARQATGSSRLWLMDRDGTAVEPCWGRKAVSLRTWTARHLPGAGLSEPVVFRRLRKTVTTAEALADPAAYLRSGRRHSAGTFFDHYANSSVLRAEAGCILMQAIGERFDTAVAGPTVVATAAQDLLATGRDAPGLDRATAGRLLAGQLDTGIAACRDPLDSPHTTPGQPCPVATTGDCYTCPNALITRDHLPAVLRLRELTDPGRAGNITAWQQRWRPIHEFITRVVLPAFTADEITAAGAVTGGVLLDVGLVNDLAGSDAPR